MFEIGVLEYWIVDRVDRTVAIYRRKNALLELVATLYESDELTSPILPGFRCCVSQLF
ncbi:Uma2 family endonuclease [Oscillatoriales cyanobacterium LEGE 11467]|uniref:Uma2 family endonuclease n=1 Tax=Zarconia navalis LEGE 11467 TaxID=1828826 RepID=A0A928VVF4_9CYAN|nr:Uma2 family endonuclease [Zarconia navalis]MBE9040962.1 Uma2 family endonuclease [Zarconia navalis LEGE 11467]